MTKFLTRIISTKYHTIISGASIMAAMYAISSLLGFIKKRLLSNAFGDAPELGLYIGADKIPNFLLTMLTVGILSAAFIPVLTKELKKDSENAHRIASTVLNFFIVIFLFLTVGLFLGSNFLVRNVLAIGDTLTNAQYALMASLMKVIMLAQIILLISSFFTSLYQISNKFFIAALAPVLYNIGLIIFIFFYVETYGIFAPAYGMIFGAFLHLFIQIIYVKQINFKYFLVLNLKDKAFIKMLKLAFPRTIGQLAPQVMTFIYTSLAYYISAVSMIIWDFANTINLVPIKMFGLSIGHASLPILSTTLENDGKKRFKVLFAKTLNQILFFTLPISVLILVLRIPLIRLAFGSKIFSWPSTVMTAYTLAFFSISIAAQAISGFIIRAFYAIQDTKTPLIINVFAIIINAFLSITFIRHIGLGVWSLALAFSIAGILNAILLLFMFIKKVGSFDLNQLISHVNKIGFASLITGFSLYLPLKTLDQLVFDTTRTINLIFLTSTVTLIGFLVYIAISYVLKVEELELIYNFLKQIKQQGIKILKSDNISPTETSAPDEITTFQ